MPTNQSVLQTIAFIALSVFASQSFGQAGSSGDDDEKYFQDGEFRCSAWEENFEGRHFRAWGPKNTDEPSVVDWLYLELDQTSGGWDTTIAKNNPVGLTIDQTDPNRTVGYEYDFRKLRTSDSGAWWSGAKVVFFREPKWIEGDKLVGSYECYVVENSNLSADGLQKRFGLKYEGDHSVWGRTYKLYTVTINGIMQVWAVRSDIPKLAKSEGTKEDPRLYIPVGQIKTQWRKKRLIKDNYYPLGWMAFIETQGRVFGEDKESRSIGSFTNLILPSNEATEAEEPLFVGDFEHGVIPLTLENKASPWYLHGNSPEVVTAPEPVRHGRFAMKSVLDRAKSKVSYRTEVLAKIDDKRKHAQMGKDYWYGFSIYFPEDWAADDIWEIVAQWHGVPDKHLGEVSRNPVMAFHSDGTNLKITNIWDAAPNTQEAQKTRKSRYDGGTTLWEGPIRKGQWTDWVVHVKWSFKDDGIVELWQNGKQIAKHRGPNTFNDRKAPYFKMGIYKGWRDRKTPAGNVSRRVIYHDEVRFAGPNGNYAVVAPPGDIPIATSEDRR